MTKPRYGLDELVIQTTSFGSEVHKYALPLIIDSAIQRPSHERNACHVWRRKRTFFSGTGGSWTRNFALSKSTRFVRCAAATFTSTCRVDREDVRGCAIRTRSLRGVVRLQVIELRLIGLARGALICVHVCICVCAG